VRLLWTSEHGAANFGTLQDSEGGKAMGYDAIVVGGGLAGSALADQLARG